MGKLMVLPLWFEHGKHVVPVFAFPRGFLDYPFQPVQDCQTYREYLAALPMLYGVIHHLVPTMAAPHVDPAQAAAFQEVYATYFLPSSPRLTVCMAGG